MKRTEKILSLSLLGAIAASAMSCSREFEVKRCIDANGVMADEQNCRQAEQYRPSYTPVSGRPLPPWWYDRWVYGGAGGYNPGDRVTGFSPTPTEGMPSMPASEALRGGLGNGGGRVSVSRGGFGGSAHGGSGE